VISNPSPSAPVRVLVVDDDPLSSSLQAHLASLLGYAVAIEEDGERAVERALAGEFDVLLLDLGMPKLDGFEVLRRLREREARDDRAPLPVVAVTGYASETDRLRCLMAGFNEHVSKPVQAATLGAAIARALGPRRGTAGEASGLAHESDAERLRATVRRLSGVKPGDRQFAPTVTESFALRSAQLIETLNLALRAADAEQAQRAARALRSSAEFLGALRLAQMGAELDRLASDSEWERAAALLRAIEHEHQAVLTLLFESAR
jgi:CheY-like chemotaxis protein